MTEKEIDHWLEKHGWTVIEYPGTQGDNPYTVYSHPQLEGVWDMEEAVQFTESRIHTGEGKC